jgi:hypothetical protein
VTKVTTEFTAAIPALPGFSWSRYAHDTADLPPGTYNVGIACARGEGKVEKFWNARIDFAASATDPGGFTWHVAGTQHVPAGHHSSATRVALIALAVVVVLAVALAIALRTRHRKLADTART